MAARTRYGRQPRRPIRSVRAARSKLQVIQVKRRHCPPTCMNLTSRLYSWRIIESPDTKRRLPRKHACTCGGVSQCHLQLPLDGCQWPCSLNAPRASVSLQLLLRRSRRWAETAAGSPLQLYRPWRHQVQSEPGREENEQCWVSSGTGTISIAAP